MAAGGSVLGPAPAVGLEQAFLALVQRAVLPLAAQVASLEAEFRSLRASMQSGGTTGPGGARSSGSLMAALASAAAVPTWPLEAAVGNTPGVSVFQDGPPVASARIQASQPSSQIDGLPGAGAARRGSLSSTTSSQPADSDHDRTQSGLEIRPTSRSEFRQPPSAPGASAIRSALQPAAVFFDFDSTLSTPQYLERAKDYALADRPKLCSSMTAAEILANFGGRGRVARVAAMLRHLESRGLALFVISLGFTQAIRHHLSSVGLGNYFQVDRIFGQDSEELSEVGHRKALLIQRLMQFNEWPRERALFVDDSKEHIQLCREVGACRTLLVRGQGLGLEEMEEVEEFADAVLQQTANSMTSLT